MINSCWIETIPLEDFDEDKSTLMTQLCETDYWSTKIQFYRKTGCPIRISNLFHSRHDMKLVWLDDESFMLSRNLPESVPHDSKYRKASTIVKFENRKVHVYGISNQSLARAIEMILCLKDERSDQIVVGHCHSSRTGPLVPTSFVTSRFLHKYMQTNPKRCLLLGHMCQLSKDESIALASHRTPLNMGLACGFVDQGRTFVETLAQRTSHFGILALHSRSFNSISNMVSSCGLRSEWMTALSNISLRMSTPNFSSSQRIALLALPARRLEYEVYTPMVFDNENESLAIVSTAVTLVFTFFLPAQLYTKFLQASGTLRELGVVYDADRPPSPAQQMELLKAIAANQDLQLLELGCLNVLCVFWEQLLDVIRAHKSLQIVVFWIRRQPDLEQVKTLLPLLKERAHLDISFKCRGPLVHLVQSMEAIIEPVRSQRRVKALTLESAHVRPAVFGAALTNWANGHFHKTSQLLSENMDLLCSLIGDPSSPRRQRTRPTQILSFPEPKKQESS